MLPDSESDSSTTSSSTSKSTSSSSSASILGSIPSQAFYEQLGANTILYRHKQSYTPFCCEHGDGHGDGHGHGSQYAPDRVDTFHSHRPWKQAIAINDVTTTRGRRDQATYILESTLNANRVRRRWRLHVEDSDEDASTLSAKDCNDKVNLNVPWKSRSVYQKIELPSIDGGGSVSVSVIPAGGMLDNLLPNIQMSQKEIIHAVEGKKQRMHASPRDGYGAPFRLQDIEYGLDADAQGQKTKMKKNRLKMEENPIYYGNCLKLLPCLCDFCVHWETENENENENDPDDESQQSMELLLNRNPQNQGGEEGKMTRYSQCPKFFLLYPKGQSIAISPIQLPLTNPLPTSVRMPDNNGDFPEEEEATEYAHHRSRHHHRSSHRHHHRLRDQTEVETGRILQVAVCANTNELISNARHTTHMKAESSMKRGIVCVVRTPTHCSVISCEPNSNHIDDDNSVESDPKAAGLQCNGNYSLKEIAKVSFDDDIHGNDDEGLTSTSSLSAFQSTRTRSEFKYKYDPIHIATKCQSGTMYGGDMEATFAVLSRRRHPSDLSSSLYGENGPNIIHLAKVHDMQHISVRRHTIQGLSGISRIEFSTIHPMVLWSAAKGKIRESGMTFYHSNHFHKRPIMGYGHSLYSIDLRCNRHNFVWSPSHDEFSYGSIHCINDILVDDYRPHSLFASCSSAAKLYHVDARMPARTVSSWSLPGVCDDNQVMNPPGGIYGNGMLLCRPEKSLQLHMHVDRNPFSQPIIGLKQDPGSCGIHLYQEAVKFGRFQTRNLERIAHNGLDPSGAHVASSYFALPDVSEGHFATGLAAFETPLSSIIQSEPDNIQKALCVMTSTSRGDIYSHTFMSSTVRTKGKSRCIHSGPIGACAVPVPVPAPLNHNNIESISNDGNLYWTVSNTAALVSNSFISDNDPTTSSQLDKIEASQTRQEGKRKATDDLITIKFGRPEQEIGVVQKVPRPRTILNGICPKKKRMARRTRKPRKQYTVKKPSENLQQIISELRAKSFSTSNETIDKL